MSHEDAHVRQLSAPIIAVTGSYNGQDSLGDECLLRSVVEQIRYAVPNSKVHILLHDTRTAFIRAFAQEYGVTIDVGLQTIYWRWRSLLLRARLPRMMADWVAPPLFPIAIIIAAAANIAGARTLLGVLFRAKAMFIFGGTQFSRQWFWLNAPCYFLSGFVVRGLSGKVFLGPQQFGPLTRFQRRALGWFIRLCVAEWRTRNTLDGNILERDARERSRREAFDEVFGNIRLYPTLRAAPQARHILVNLRALTFDTDEALSKTYFHQIGKLVSMLGKRYRLPIVFFAVSDSSFCDDEAVLAYLRASCPRPETLTSIGRVRSELQFFKLAQAAKVVVSMSFHGCILSAISGAPFVPVTEGAYYDYKYAGFDKYAGGQSVPIIGLTECEPSRDLERILDYVERFEPSHVERARIEAARLSDEFYGGALRI